MLLPPDYRGIRTRTRADGYLFFGSVCFTLLGMCIFMAWPLDLVGPRTLVMGLISEVAGCFLAIVGLIRALAAMRHNHRSMQLILDQLTEDHDERH